MQHHRQSPASLSLKDHCIHIAWDGAMRPCAKTAERLGNADNDAASMQGRMLALHHLSGPRDAHYPVWEMHPAGDELLLLASGSLSVEYRAGGAERSAPLPAHAAFIVPAGVWHRVVVHEPSVLMAMTPRRGTVHEKG
jgi:mannose-6-phosphate isomerase-like protein (cupin superfamily)